MDRTLDPEVISLALGVHTQLPSPEGLADAMANAEVALLIQGSSAVESLLPTAWYLHGIASTPESVELYAVDRRRAAFSIAAHIFDLALQHSRSAGSIQMLEWTFAAQVAYLNSNLDPNALALFARDAVPFLSTEAQVTDHDHLALSLAVALVAADANYLFPVLDALRIEEAGLFEDSRTEFADSPLAATLGVVRAVRHLIVFLVYGDETRLAEARETLQVALAEPTAEFDQTCRWVCAHLLTLIDHFGVASIWTALPPEVPPGIRRAFAMATPRVVTLWPPQLDALRVEEETQPLDPGVKRALLAMPTSAGKSLMGQLIVAAHLGMGLGGVCYVAPTRSLCNEVRRALDERLRNVDFTVVGDLPDWGEVELEADVNIEVMTPERLSYLVRADASSVLERFTLFVFDEVHNVADRSRGWNLETTIAYLHALTRNSPHRMVLMSAALGNQAHFASWLGSGGGEPAIKSSSWRGPRRLHCLWETVRDDAAATIEKTSSTHYPRRRIIPLRGRLHARVTRTGRPAVLTTTEPVGRLVMRYPPQGPPSKDKSASTANYKMLVPLIQMLAEAGPVLVIEGTRPSTLRTAKEIAQRVSLAVSPAMEELIDLVLSRLGPDHPLSSVLRQGVGYHHGSLPLDVREGIEQAMRDGDLRILVATTSLTEGVNLPVRSVVIVTQGAYGAEGYEEFITQSRLVNAIGRAGRAAQETEGVVVLNRMARVSIDDFDRLDPAPSELNAMSILATQDLLANLDGFEAALRESFDAIFDVEVKELSDFLTFVWFLASESERIEGEIKDRFILSVLESTPGWQQLSQEYRNQVASIANLTATLIALATRRDATRLAEVGCHCVAQMLCSQSRKQWPTSTSTNSLLVRPRSSLP